MLDYLSAIIHIKYAGVAELADALDLGSSVSDMQVRPLSPAPKIFVTSVGYIFIVDFSNTSCRYR